MLFFQAFGKKYGYQPKCVRMKILHQLLFYIVHDYSGDPELDQEKALAVLSKSAAVTNDVEQEMSRIYKPVLDWRMFIPPLPVHTGVYFTVEMKNHEPFMKRRAHLKSA